MLSSAHLLATGCATAPPFGGDWQALELNNGGRPQAAALRGKATHAPLTGVIDGDGRAHDRAGRPTSDPTPARTVGLDIAKAWPGGGVAWMARRCQYTRRHDPACHPDEWTLNRFSATAVETADAALDLLKQRAGAEKVVLVGWSGGGVIAAALATRRADVAGLVTIAAPLDVAGWVRSEGLSSLNTAREVSELGRRPLSMPQVHLFGAEDDVVPAHTAMSAATTMAGPAGLVDIVHERGHCCWADRTARIAADLEAARKDQASARSAAASAAPARLETPSFW